MTDDGIPRGWARAPAGEPRRWFTQPRNEFQFGPYQASYESQLPRGLPKKGGGGSTRLTLSDQRDVEVSAHIGHTNTPLSSDLVAGIPGSVREVEFIVRRRDRFALRRADRVINVTGENLDLWLATQRRRFVVRRGGSQGPVLWKANGGGQLNCDARPEEAAVVCLLLLIKIQYSTSMLRMLAYL